LDHKETYSQLSVTDVTNLELQCLDQNILYIFCTKHINQKASGLLGNSAQHSGAGRQVLLPSGAGECGLRRTLQTEDPRHHATSQDQVSALVSSTGQ